MARQHSEGGIPSSTNKQGVSVPACTGLLKAAASAGQLCSKQRCANSSSKQRCANSSWRGRWALGMLGWNGLSAAN
jgi:hypothetical protein